MSDMLTKEPSEEQIARAICTARELDPDTLYQHLGDDFPVDATDSERRTFFKAWRKWSKAAQAVRRLFTALPPASGDYIITREAHEETVLLAHKQARAEALAEAAVLCKREAAACLSDIVPGDEIGRREANARAGALLTAEQDILALAAPVWTQEQLDTARKRADRLDKYFNAQLQRICEHYDMRSELYTSDAELAAGLAGIARAALATELMRALHS